MTKVKPRRPLVNGRYPNAIRNRMEKNKLTITALADKLDMSRPYLNRLINGQKLCHVTTALAIARELGTTVEYLWGDLDFEEVRYR